jgi:ABC-type transport system involved in multi-copper enzyme maturation permease subunit
MLDKERYNKMIWQIAQQEILNNLKSIKLIIAFLIIILLMLLSGIIFTVKYEHLVEDYHQAVNDNLVQLKKEAKTIVELSYQQQSIYTEPNPLQFCAEGGETDLPNAYKVGYFSLEAPQSLKRENFMFAPLTELDWAFVIGVFISFVALGLSYRTISGEKEDGTLGLMLSNPIPRGIILLGKYIGIMISILLPFIIGIILNLIVILIRGNVPLEGLDWLRILLVLGVSLFYISLFVLLGLIVSSMTTKPVISLIMLLSLWIIFVIIIPNTGGMFASEFFKIPSRYEIDENISATSDAIWNAAPEAAYNGDWTMRPTGEVPLYIRQRAKMVQEITVAENRAYEHFVDQMIHQVSLARNITRLSPTAIYQYASEAIVGTGLARFKHFSNQVRAYRGQLITFVNEEDQKDPNSYHLIYRWENLASRKPVSFEAIPKFTDGRLSIRESIKGAFLDISLLVLLNGLFFMIAFGVFYRYDVR